MGLDRVGQIKTNGFLAEPRQVDLGKGPFKDVGVRILR